MAGLGFGLPMAALYAEFFGGGIQLHTLPGFGTDAYIRLSRLGSRSVIEI